MVWNISKNIFQKCLFFIINIFKWLYFFCWSNMILFESSNVENIFCSNDQNDTLKRLLRSTDLWHPSVIFTSHEILPLLLFVVPSMRLCPQLRERSHMKRPWPVGSLAPWAKWQGPAGWTLKLPNTFTADSSGPAGRPALAVVGHFSWSQCHDYDSDIR